MREWLKEMRTERGLTCKQMGEYLGVTDVYYFLIETGQRKKKLDIDTAQKLSKILKVPLRQIVSWEMEVRSDAGRKNPRGPEAGLET